MIDDGGDDDYDDGNDDDDVDDDNDNVVDDKWDDDDDDDLSYINQQINTCAWIHVSIMSSLSSGEVSIMTTIQLDVPAMSMLPLSSLLTTTTVIPIWR